GSCAPSARQSTGRGWLRSRKLRRPASRSTSSGSPPRSRHSTRSGRIPLRPRNSISAQSRKRYRYLAPRSTPPNPPRGPPETGPGRRCLVRALRAPGCSGEAHMKQGTLTQRIEQELERAGLYAAVEDSDGALILSGRVDTAEDRQAAEDIVRELAPDRRIDNQLEVEMMLPERVGGRASDEPIPSDLPDSVGQVREWGGDVEPDFAEQPTFTDASEEPGPSSWG